MRRYFRYLASAGALVLLIHPPLTAQLPTEQQSAGFPPRSPAAAVGSRDSQPILPAKTFTDQNDFKFPFSVQVEPSQSTQVWLYLSQDGGQKWTRFAQSSLDEHQDPRQRHFIVQGLRDGEYWFLVRTEQQLQTMLPGPRDRPQKIVVIDTRRPNVRYQIDPMGPTQRVVRWEISDPNLDLDSLSIEYQVGSESWVPLPVVGTRRVANQVFTGQTAPFPAPSEGLRQVRLRVSDRAGNLTVALRSTPAEPTADSTAIAPATEPRKTPSESTAKPPQTEGGLEMPPAFLRPRASDRSSLDGQAPAPGSQAPASPAAPAGPADPAGAASEPPFDGPPSVSESGAERQTPAERQLSVPGNTRSLDRPLPPPRVTSGASADVNEQPRDDRPDLPDWTTAPPLPSFDWALPSQNATAADSSASETTLPPTGAGSPIDSNGSFPSRSTQPLPGDRPHGLDDTARSESGRSAAFPPISTSRPPWPPGSAPDGTIVTVPVSTARLEREQAWAVGSHEFQLEYDLENVAYDALARVDLYQTADGGSSWTYRGEDMDRQSPVQVKTEQDGIYGYRLHAVGRDGLAGPKPQSGDAPDVWVCVDTARPEAVFDSIQLAPSSPTTMTIRWTARDLWLDTRPITLEYARPHSSTWETIAAGLPNTGSFDWKLDERLPSQVLVRMVVRDRAGNETAVQAPNPVATSNDPPAAKIRGIRGADDR